MGPSMTGGVEWAPGPNVVGMLEPKQGAEVIHVGGGRGAPKQLLEPE